MAEGLKKKVGPLPLWGWLAVVGGTVGVVILYKKGKAKAASTEEPTQFLQGVAPGQPEVGSGASAGGGGASPEAKTPTFEAPIFRTFEPSPSPTSGAPTVSQIGEGLRELEALGFVRPNVTPGNASKTPGPKPKATATKSHRGQQHVTRKPHPVLAPKHGHAHAPKPPVHHNVKRPARKRPARKRAPARRR